MLIGITDFESSGTGEVEFQRGELVRHKQYGYRGVIVAYDLCCQASEKWYYSNKTQPPRNQPWYHVLVDQSGGLNTYVAQSNLEPDPSKAPIDHPRLGNYFSAFKDGVYV